MEKKLSDLRFVDDVALTTEGVKDAEHRLITVNEESLKIGLKIHKGKPKCDKYCHNRQHANRRDRNRGGE